MNKEQALKLPRFTPNPKLAGLSDYVKNPANFDKIQRILLDTLAGQHTHSEMVTWATCKTCQEKVAIHGALMRKLGFKSPAIYYSWKKIMEMILDKDKRRVKIR